MAQAAQYMQQYPAFQYPQYATPQQQNTAAGTYISDYFSHILFLRLRYTAKSNSNDYFKL